MHGSGKVLRQYGSSLPAGCNPMDLGMLWLMSLPIREDEAEAQVR